MTDLAMTEKLFICLYGPHKSGKSTIGKAMAEEHGFIRAHPFNPGRAASLCWLSVHGIHAEHAERLVDGDLKDTPWTVFPKDAQGDHYSMRKLMDVVGHFTGVGLGPEWTIDMDVQHRDFLDRSDVLDVSGMSEAMAMAAAYAMFGGASSDDARLAVMTGSTICDAALPSGSVSSLVTAFDGMFETYGLEGWRGRSADDGTSLAPLRLVPQGNAASPGYILESAIHEMNYLRHTKADRCVVIRITPETKADVDDEYASAVVSDIIPDFDFLNPMISKEDTWLRFCDFLSEHRIMDKTLTGPTTEPC